MNCNFDNGFVEMSDNSCIRNQGCGCNECNENRDCGCNHNGCEGEGGCGCAQKEYLGKCVSETKFFSVTTKRFIAPRRTCCCCKCRCCC